MRDRDRQAAACISPRFSTFAHVSFRRFISFFVMSEDVIDLTEDQPQVSSEICAFLCHVVCIFNYNKTNVTPLDCHRRIYSWPEKTTDKRGS